MQMVDEIQNQLLIFQNQANLASINLMRYSETYKLKI